MYIKPNRVIELKDINLIFAHIHKMQIFLNKDIFYHKSFLKEDSNLTEKVKKQFRNYYKKNKVQSQPVVTKLSFDDSVVRFHQIR